MSSQQETGIALKCVRVSNFRALANIEVELSDLTVLLGANNSGKTSFLEALCLAIGLGQSRMTQDDMYVGKGEAKCPADRQATIDVLIRPVDKEGQIQPNFSGGDFWTNVFGDGISLDDEGEDFVAIRTKLNVDAGEISRKRVYLAEWLAYEDWLQADEKKRSVSSKTLEPFAIQYIDAKRDLGDELNRQTSFWGRLTADLGFEISELDELAAGLEDLNSSICEKSSVLDFIGNDLKGLDSVINPGSTDVTVTAVPLQVRDLSKNLNVSISSTSEQSFPLAKHGVGTRSFSSLLIFRAYAKWKQRLAAAKEDLFHPILALEEPEAHLHPQAQRALFQQMKAIPGQRIVSSHSPYFASQIDLSDLRLFHGGPNGVRVHAFDAAQLQEEDRRRLEREILATRGDLLFARAIILCEGETEEQALPIFAEHYFGRSIHEYGFCFVGVGGKDNYLPFLRLATSFGIPWYVFSDGEADTVRKLNADFSELHVEATTLARTFKVIPNGADFEGYLVESGYQDEIEAAMAQTGIPGPIDSYIFKNKNNKRKGGLPRGYEGPAGSTRAVLDALRENKTTMASLVANAIVCSPTATHKVPPLIKELFDHIKEDLSIRCP